MANTRELRRRIKSVKNTAQITKAMQMVAATKMRRAEAQAMAGRPYLQVVAKSLQKLFRSPQARSYQNPLLNSTEKGATGILLLSTDKSLCGALNANLLRFTHKFMQNIEHPVFYTVGKKGRNFVVKMSQELFADFENNDSVSFQEGAQMAKMMAASFLKGELKNAFIIYPHFISALTQEPRASQLLPLDKKAFTEVELENEGSEDYLLEPKAQDLLDYLITHFYETTTYQALLETKASEHSARMLAMQNATDNAKELAGDLNLLYNQTRQASITNELLEITSAVAALE
ncbi:ATP synthase F1 subunit gamma [Candidatus Daviesbacteria bacterium RIFCSPHIGHO2_01_FULL_44_29]|uniref:ATP synthase gamma chain n=1 Tax=Candidatus Daviesbacteria bacterium RIFCSPHIGHO2_02_FULL_43_12 TaxID=1797776 RepID=A0A1F5KFK8_9BACT|nr:MAG: ATP synthase F1 subunit gamma [Candidatus Daviesbacteria bacterium RIFCSPHIGHO2_01_FULL_44_29]OGE38845.1 MAG: ATP synthase F1 subunit gamma [Candidatus Daviesbacteria bacterium RIFCSPHIGHO2_12_FULL_47_45]OGE39742.1 MAG: ATP synthase F1 subunit gamma [Candidatus Daviesbacteria bacterium RIFCSPHIGHO2_02_FULL_43_12]OGE69967.1 MAG: ATP synthase F1 subunit gamma [Candidatus Daviesbacteria bacterium RIFCSPLOWO2_01_FULL_43_15]